MNERFYNTPARKGFHWPGRIVAGENVGAAWLAENGTAGLAVIADRAFAEHDLVKTAGGAFALIAREPSRDDVIAIAAKLASNPPATILALGGGATLDASKAIVARLRFGTLDIRDRPRDGASPRLIAAPTTAGSGSETSRFFILSDPETAVKVATRSWSIVPDLTLLDPALLLPCQPQRLLLGAFDAAIHLWETHIARGERSVFTDALAQTFLPRILAALPAITSGDEPPGDVLTSLMEASAMAGVALSNVRTGMMHTLGESLAAQCALPHPLTLRVFLRPVIESYASAIRDHVAPLFHTADAVAPWGAPWSIERFITAWEDAFEVLDLDRQIRGAFAARRPSLDALCDTAARDTTLAKENPLPLEPAELWSIAGTGFAAFLPQRAA